MNEFLGKSRNFCCNQHIAWFRLYFFRIVRFIPLKIFRVKLKNIKSSPLHTNKIAAIVIIIPFANFPSTQLPL